MPRLLLLLKEFQWRSRTVLWARGCWQPEPHIHIHANAAVGSHGAQQQLGWAAMWALNGVGISAGDQPSELASQDGDDRVAKVGEPKGLRQVLTLEAGALVLGDKPSLRRREEKRRAW